MKTASEQLVSLAETLATHQGVTHWAISMRLTGRGDTFMKYKRGGEVRASTYVRLLGRFDADWPSDLEWPADVPRTSTAGKEVAS